MSKRAVLAGGLALIILGVTLPLGYLAFQNQQDSADAAKQQAAAKSVQLEDPTIVAAGASKGSPTPGATSGLVTGSPIARLLVPRFGSDWSRVVYEGTSVSKVLTPLGVGHYSGTALPGEVGNFALAAHRAGSGGPFRNIDKLRDGDLVFVETASKRFTYRFLQSTVVDPGQAGVIAPTPVGLTKPAANGEYLTLTSCTPIHINTQRYVVWFELISTDPL